MQRRFISVKPIPNVKSIIAVAAGKGGVGKSTIAGSNSCLLAISQHCSVSHDAKFTRRAVGWRHLWTISS